MEYVQELRKAVGHRPLITIGAVVIMFNPKGQILFQQRTNGDWGLPGGLMELGESLEETAKREVYEETGLRIGELELYNIFSGKEFYLKLNNQDELYPVTVVYVSSDFKGELIGDYKETMDLQFYYNEDRPENVGFNYQRFLDRYYREVNIKHYFQR